MKEGWFGLHGNGNQGEALGGDKEKKKYSMLDSCRTFFAFSSGKDPIALLRKIIGNLY